MTEVIATGNQPTGQKKKRERKNQNMSSIWRVLKVVTKLCNHFENPPNACSGVKLAVRFRLELGT